MWFRLFLSWIIFTSPLVANATGLWNPHYTIQYDHYLSRSSLDHRLVLPLNLTDQWQIRAVHHHWGDVDQAIGYTTESQEDSLRMAYHPWRKLKLFSTVARRRSGDHNDYRENRTTKYHLGVGWQWNPQRHLQLRGWYGWLSDVFESGRLSTGEMSSYLRNQGVAVHQHARWSVRTPVHRVRLTSENQWENRTYTTDFSTTNRLNYRLNPRQRYLPQGQLRVDLKTSQQDRFRSVERIDRERSVQGGGSLLIRYVWEKRWQVQIRGILNSLETTYDEPDTVRVRAEQSRQLSGNLRYQLTRRIQLQTEFSRRLTQFDHRRREDGDRRLWKAGLRYQFSERAHLQLDRRLQRQRYDYRDPSSQRYNRDLLDSDTFLRASFPLTGATWLKLDISVQEHHLIYLDAAESASNRRSTVYTLAPLLGYRIHPRVSVRQRFSLTADYTIYDFTEDQNWFYRRLASWTEVTVYVPQAFNPQANPDSIGVAYNLDLRDQGQYTYDPYLTTWIYQQNYRQNRHRFTVFIKKSWGRGRLTVYPQFQIDYEPLLNLTDKSFAKIRWGKLIRRETRWRMIYTVADRVNLRLDAVWIEEPHRKNYWDATVRLAYQP
ncbi:MAG: hypothetical protein D6675_02025 [Gemmatimonadetes bacterium]|nr:MAG: hypothetical protein D6675_02025 [Gemmatimonadota bacterium]